MEIICPSYVNTAIRLLNQSGFKAFIVGGCVRDKIMGKEPNDWDMTTSARPEETMEVFRDFRTIPTGLKHGTVTVLIEGHPLEITTMRIDGDYLDSRRPDSVRFTDEITCDLSRRDFTVNAMAYSPDTGLCDPFGGREDIKNKVIRCVGDPARRFGEDALRIIRALRFASVLGFDIDEDTKKSIIKNHMLMQNIASERIRVELLKLLTGKNVERILSEYKEVIFGIIPELEACDGFPQNTPYHIYDVWTHTVKVVGAVKRDPIFRFAALLHDVCKPECFRTDEKGIAHFKTHPEKGAEKTKEIMRRLHFSNIEISTAYSLVLLHDRRPDGSKAHLARLCSEHSLQSVQNALELLIADAAGKAPDYYHVEFERYTTAKKQLEEIQSEQIPLSPVELDINGSDLMNAGFSGKEIRSALNELLICVIDGKTENKKENLLEQAKFLKKF